MFLEEVIELRPQGRERSRLDLDQQAGSPDVDDETVERDLEPVAGAGVLGLQGGVQRALVERADVGVERDGATVGRPAAADGDERVPPSSVAS